MNLRMSALLSIRSDGTQKIASETGKIAQNLDKAQKSANKMSATTAGGLARSGGIPMGDGDGLDRRSHAVARGVAGSRGAAGRDFAGLAQLGGETNGLVAAYATLAANIFALTAAFKALSDAAKFVQLQKGLETVGAQSGKTLSIVAQNMEKMSGYAISTVEAMKSVASATAAGFSGKEIERLTRVAKGASVALGRDMSDSIDRLTRGTIKLEPELLDELGIMTRLDEATRAYALQNQVSASSLTTLQRRQAFLNAVLAEGETKFGDIADAVDSSTYDKLAASIKKFGTETLSTLNGALKPFIDALIAVPALGLLPLAGMLSTAFGKLIPDMDQNIQRHTAKVGMMTEGYIKARNTMQGLLDKRNTMIQSVTTGEEAWLKQFLGRKGFNPNLAVSSNQSDIQKKINILKAEEARIENLLNIAGNKNNQVLKNKLDIVKQTIQAQETELSFQKQGTTFTRRLVKEDVGELVSNRQAQIMQNLSDKVYASGGSIWGTLKAYGSAIKDQFKLASDAGKQAISVTEEFNGRLDNGKEKLNALSKASIGFGGAMKAVGGFIDIGVQALQSFMGPIFIIIAAVQVLGAAWSWVDENLLGNTKRVKELRDDLKAMQETAGKTAIEMEKLAAAGRFGQAIDASLSSMTELYNKTKELREEQEKARSSSGYTADSIANREVAPPMLLNGGDWGPQWVTTTFSDEISSLPEEVQKSVIATGDLLKLFGEDAQDAFIGEIQKIKDNPDQVNTYLEETQYLATLAGGSFKDMSSAAKSAGETLSKIRKPDIFTTNYSPVVANINDIAKSYKLLKSAIDSFPKGDSSIAKAALGEQIADGGVAFVAEIGRLGGNSDQLFALYDKAMQAESKLSAARLTNKENSKAVKQATDELATANRQLVDAIDMTRVATLSSAQDAKTVLDQVKLATGKLTLSLGEAEASALKMSANILKLRKEKELLASVGTTKYANSALQEVEAAKTSLAVAEQTAKVKKEIIELEYGLLEAEAKLALQTQEDETRNLNPALYEAITAGSTVSTIKLKSFEPDEVSNMITRVEALKQYKDQIDKIVGTKDQLLKNSGLEITQEKESYKVAVEKLKAYNSFSQALMRNHELSKKQVESDKERLAITKQISDLQVNSFRSNIERTAFRENRSVSAEEQRSVQEMILKKTLENLKSEQELVLKEHDLKMTILNLEFNMQKLTHERELANIEKSKTFTAEEKKTFTALENATFNTAESIFNQAIESGNALRAKIVEKQGLEETAAQDALKYLPTVLEQFLHDFWKPQNDATRAYNNSGGTGLGALLGLADPASMNKARELGANAPKDMDPKTIQAMAVQQELFNLELTFTDQVLSGIADSFANMFNGLIDGTVKAKEAFKQFALSIFKMIAEIATRMLILQTLQMFLPKAPGANTATSAASMANPEIDFLGFLNGLTKPSGGAAGGIIPMATGGIINRRMGVQSVITKPTYLVGEGKYNEAVVPLPNGRNIPVQLLGGSSNKNNVQVNVNITDSGTTVDKSGEGMNDLGARIAMAVQKELLAQKAPGGILNKYGVA